MTKKVIRELIYPVLELVFRCNKDNVWMSVEAVKDDHIFKSIVYECMKKSEYKSLFDDVCCRIDSCFNIKKDKIKIKNIIKVLGDEENKLCVMTMGLVLQRAFEKEEASFNEYVGSAIMLNTDLKFIQDNLQYDKFHNSFITNSKYYGLSEKIHEFLLDVYYDAVAQGYDIFSFFKYEVYYES